MQLREPRPDSPAAAVPAQPGKGGGAKRSRPGPVRSVCAGPAWPGTREPPCEPSPPAQGPCAAPSPAAAEDGEALAYLFSHQRWPAGFHCEKRLSPRTAKLGKP